GSIACWSICINLICINPSLHRCVYKQKIPRGREVAGGKTMSKAAAGQSHRIDHFFSGPGARGDQWANLVERAEAWSTGSGNRAEFEAGLAEIAATEEFHAYPGIELMTALRDRAAEDDARATASLARRITRSIL